MAATGWLPARSVTVKEATPLIWVKKPEAGANAFQRLRPDTALPDLRDGRSHPSTWAYKAYAAVEGACRAGINSPLESIIFSWQSQQVPIPGLWLNHGALPEEHPVDQIAFESAAAPADDQCGAERTAHVRVPAPG